MTGPAAPVRGAAATALPAGETVRVTADADVRLVVSGRADGNMSLRVGAGDVLGNRRALLARVGAGLHDAVFMAQTHGRGVATVGVADRGRGARAARDAVADTDALVTFAPGVALTVLVADCVPVLLADPGRGVAAVHAGRRGVQARVVEAALEALAPPDPRAVHAVVGPAVGPCCYEVSPALAAEVVADAPAAAGTTTWGSPSLDLPGAVVAQLARAGVTDVAAAGACTACAPQTWFSHRADPGAGRQAAVIVRGGEVDP